MVGVWLTSRPFSLAFPHRNPRARTSLPDDMTRHSISKPGWPLFQRQQDEGKSSSLFSAGRTNPGRKPHIHWSRFRIARSTKTSAWPTCNSADRGLRSHRQANSEEFFSSTFERMHFSLHYYGSALPGWCGRAARYHIALTNLNDELFGYHRLLSLCEPA